MIKTDSELPPQFPVREKEYKPGTIFLEEGNPNHLCIIISTNKNSTDEVRDLKSNMFRYNILLYICDMDEIGYKNFGWHLFSNSEILYDAP